MTNAGPITGPRGMECVLVLLTLGFPADPLDPESCATEFDTWTVGLTEKGTINQWKRENPTLAANLIRTTVVTPCPKPKEPKAPTTSRSRYGQLKYG